MITIEKPGKRIRLEGKDNIETDRSLPGQTASLLEFLCEGHDLRSLAIQGWLLLGFFYRVSWFGLAVGHLSSGTRPLRSPARIKVLPGWWSINRNWNVQDGRFYYRSSYRVFSSTCLDVNCNLAWSPALHFFSCVIRNSTDDGLIKSQ